jgi:hypothetical protein
MEKYNKSPKLIQKSTIHLEISIHFKHIWLCKALRRIKNVVEHVLSPPFSKNEMELNSFVYSTDPLII